MQRLTPGVVEISLAEGRHMSHRFRVALLLAVAFFDLTETESIAASSALCIANTSSAPRSCPESIPPPGYRPAPTIVRDGYGVPHVQAASLYDAAWANGWIHSQDRLVQSELTRRSATGQ